VPETFGKRGKIAQPEPAAARAPAPVASPAAAAGQVTPEFKKFAARLGMVCGLAVVGVLGLFHVQPASRASRIAGLIPQAELPKTAAEGTARSADLVARFPGDPRAHVYRAAKFLNDGDAVAAEQELRTAMAEKNVLGTPLPAQFEQGVHLLFAMALLTQGRRDDAKIEAQPVCGTEVPLYENVLQSLKSAGLCS